jgi:hypothetical protein
MSGLLENIKADQVFTQLTENSFEKLALSIFKLQSKNCRVYSEYLKILNCDPKTVEKISQIPFLPVEFFNDFKVVSGEFTEETIFTSSATTQSIPSKHYIKSLSHYEDSFMRSFKQFYSDPSKYTFLALLPSYLERSGSSLVYMVNHLINKGQSGGGFFLYNFDDLKRNIVNLITQNRKIFLWGVSFALVDFSEFCQIDLSSHIVMETGGMKGRKEEITREALHSMLKASFNLTNVHSEYGMTELLSQAYSKQDGVFSTPPWMKIYIRDLNDPMSVLGYGKTGAINIIDLANIYSCSFLATQDLGIINPDNTFRVLGRTDNSDVRGCSLMTN